MEEKVSIDDKRLLMTQANYYLLRETFKIPSGETNIKEFYKTVHLHPNAGRAVVAGNEYIADNNFTKQLHKATGINKNAILGLSLLTAPIMKTMEEWNVFFGSSTNEEIRSRYVFDLLEELGLQFNKYMNGGRPVSCDGDVTDLFRWYFYLKTGKCFDMANLLDVRLADFQRVTGYTTDIWMNCPTDVLDKCISNMEKQLEMAKSIKVINSIHK